MVSLDIEGAFDNAWWPAIKLQLIKKNCPRNLRNLVNSYLENRNVQVRYAGETCTKATTKGCVQGSIAGPIFWNLLLDPLLDALDEQRVYFQAFADDVVLVFFSKTSENIQTKANDTLNFINTWGNKNKLKFAAHKTNAMVLTKKLNYDNPCLMMAGSTIELVNEIKILGLTLDSKLTFKKHISNNSKKVLNIYKQLSRAAKVSWGLNSEVTRTMYVSVIEPIILYAASVWAPAVKKIGVQKHLNTIQRGFAQKICKSYRTVSLHSALLLAGLIPLDLRVHEHADLYEAKRGRPILCLPDDRELERRVSFMTAEHPARDIEIGFSCLEDLEPATVEKYQLKGQLIFTDGSKIEGKVGAAISVWREGEERRAIKFKLERYCTVYQAELFALWKAVELVREGKERQTCIFSDSPILPGTAPKSEIVAPSRVRDKKEHRANSKPRKGHTNVLDQGPRRYSRK
ncbi:jg18388 [Pararge aegeria aegeria]|uniref:Jg18388 protein n=1 Tax=Pararge aegeria aegeria TaxID=348720 RepID=A0A8S4QSH1_9NEOP|nr:jg18388 [Pararge aegeria aegeria]